MATWISKDPTKPYYGKEVINVGGKIVQATKTVGVLPSGKTYNIEETSLAVQAAHQGAAVITTSEGKQMIVSQQLAGQIQKNISAEQSSAKQLASNVVSSVTDPLWTVRGSLKVEPQRSDLLAAERLQSTLAAQSIARITAGTSPQLAPAESFLAKSFGSPSRVYQTIVSPKEQLMREQEIARISSIKAYTSFQLGQGSYGSYLGAKGKEVWASAKKGAFEVITAPVEVGALYLGGTLLGGVGATTPSFIGAAEPVVIPSVAQSLSSTFLVASAVSNKQNPAKSIGETLGGVAAYSVVTAPFEAVRLTTTMPRLKEAGTKLEVEQVTTSKSGLVQRDITKVVKFDVTKGLTGKKIGTVAYGIKGTEIANAKGFAEGYFQVSATETIGDITRTFTGNKLATTTFGGKTPLTVFEWIKPAAQGKEVTYGIIKGTDVYRSGRNLIYGRSSIIVGKELITPKVSKISGINIRQYSIPKYPWQPEQVFKTTTQFGAIASIGSVTSEIKIPRTRTTLVGGIPISYSYKKPVKVSITKEMFKGFEVKSTQTKMKLGEFLGAKPLTTTLKPVIRKVSAKSRPLDWSTGKSTFTKQRAKTTTKQALVQEVRVVGSPELKAISENQFTSQKTGQITALGAVPALKLATKQDQSQVQLNKQGLSYELRQLPAQDMRLVQLPKVDIKLTQLQMPITETALLPKQVQTPRTFTPLFPSTPYAPSTFETPTFAIPPIKVGGIGLPMGSGYTSWSKVKFKPKYFASLQATAFNIRGKPTKLAIVSGLGIRPIRI